MLEFVIGVFCGASGLLAVAWYMTRQTKSEQARANSGIPATSISMSGKSEPPLPYAQHLAEVLKNYEGTRQ
jgi:hypothetical protein